MDTTGTAVSRDAAAREVGAQMATAAIAWLDSLDPQQRKLATGSAPSPDAEQDAERRRWFYTPVDHGGLALGDQRPAQQRLAHRLVASGLSTAGYVTVATIIGLDNILDHAEGWSVDLGRERGRDPGLYYLRVFGEPGGAGPWSWRFGGHHISLNNLIVAGMVRSTTPCFLGADPAASPLPGPARLRPLGIPVVRDEGAPANAEQDGVRGRLPYRDGAFDLVIDRHESFLATEVYRVLRPGGSFVTQQVDAGSFDDLFVALDLEPPAAAESWLPLARAQLEDAGFVVAVGRRGEEHEAFGDVGVVVWYLRAVPWIMPGFDPLAMEPALRRLHRACRDRPLLVRQRRFLVVAEKPASDAGESRGVAIRC